MSFIGAHAGRLQPPWMLRSALVSLVLAMIAAMYRNWKFPFYLYAHYLGRDLIAKQEKQRAKKDYIVAIPALGLEDGQLINVQEYIQNFEKEDKPARNGSGQRQFW